MQATRRNFLPLAGVLGTDFACHWWFMSKKYLLIFLLFALPSFGQSTVTIAPQQCVWRSGDDPAWAMVSLDETGWQPNLQWKLNPNEPRIWVRCHANLSSLRQVDQPALQIALYSAYQIFADGQLIGSAGNLQTGSFNMNTVRNWPLKNELKEPTVIALRITLQIASIVPLAELPPLEIHAGDEASLRDRRDALAFARIRRQLVPVVCFSIICVIGVILLSLYLNDRSRLELLLLGINSIALPFIYLNYLGAAIFLPYPLTAYFACFALPALISNLARTLFFFVLARRRVPLLFWLLIGVVTLLYPATIAVPLLPPAQALWLDTFRVHQIGAITELAGIIESLAPFIAFLPWANLTRRMKPIAALCMAWGATMMGFFAVRFTSAHIPGVPDLGTRWALPVSDLEAINTLGVCVALLALLFREQQQTARKRAVLSGEIQAARSVQRYLIPEHLPHTPRIAIESEYRPALDVGGDFFQVLPQASDGSLLIVIGDVAGKGVEAGMLATLIVGAIRTAAAFTSDPASILALLNERLRGRGLVTCLALRIEQDGTVALVNAGHLPPYLNGVELTVEGALPLGAVPGLSFPVSRFTLSEGDSLMLMTDGVAEAQDADGALFGFERIGDLLRKGTTGTALANSAQNFGQLDDITVLTLTMAPVGVVIA